MGSTTHTKHHCDNCDKKLPDESHVTIVTSKSEESYCWSRLRVIIEYYHGAHNNGTIDPADLCQLCAVALLTDALKRVKAGERSSAGVDDVEMVKF
jgi:hypothetical protein